MELKGWESGVECLLEEGLLSLKVLAWSCDLIFKIAAVKRKPVSGCFVHELRGSAFVGAGHSAHLAGRGFNCRILMTVVSIWARLRPTLLLILVPSEPRLSGVEAMLA